jgi:RNA polymerase sigma factor (sigma-70 family)
VSVLSEPSERLAERASAGDKRAFAAIFERYHQGLHRYCVAILGNSDDAQDALQSTMVKVLASLPGERRRIELKPWLYRVAHNEAIEIVRRRRETAPIDVEQLGAVAGADSVLESRERLRRLVSDLQALPERQRGALVMRELSGLAFEEIGVAFEMTPAVARQTVYEARAGLKEMELGRAMACEEVERKLSDGDRRVIKRRDVRAHLRGCAECRDFEASIAARRRDLGAIAPLPAFVAAGLLKGTISGAAAGGTASGAGMAGAGAGLAGKAFGTSALVKTVAAVAVVATVGVGAAERGDLVHVFGGDHRSAPASPLDSAPATAGPSLDQASGAAASGRAGRSERAGALAPRAAVARPVRARDDSASGAPSSSAASAEADRPTGRRHSSPTASSGANAHGANAHANPKAAAGSENRSPRGSASGGDAAKPATGSGPPATLPDQAKAPKEAPGPPPKASPDGANAPAKPAAPPGKPEG